MRPSTPTRVSDETRIALVALTAGRLRLGVGRSTFFFFSNRLKLTSKLGVLPMRTLPPGNHLTAKETGETMPPFRNALLQYVLEKLSQHLL